ncbi:MAG: RNA polymerase subunit sigma-70, partial [Hyphomonas sp.]|nr:RNA polymerase subunit sigma-70 [Hyphomonas sp.]
CGVAVGTIKSRVSRARKAVVEILESNGAGYSDDSNMKAEDAFNDIMRQADDIAGVG